MAGRPEEEMVSVELPVDASGSRRDERACHSRSTGLRSVGMDLPGVRTARLQVISQGREVEVVAAAGRGWLRPWT